MKKLLVTRLFFGIFAFGHVYLCGQYELGAQYSSQMNTPDILVQENVSEFAPKFKYGEAPLGLPEFEFGAIKLKSGGLGRCGGVTLVPYPGYDVIVRSQRYRKGWFGKEAIPTANPLSGWVEVPQSGLRVKYDRAGLGEDHYKIHCRVVGPNGSRSADCQRVLSMHYVKQGHCLAGLGGTDAQYSPLNMRTKSR